MAVISQERRARWNLFVRLALPIATMAVVLGLEIGGPPPSFAGSSVGLLALAVASYSLSHVLRAFRLVLVAVPILPLRSRVLFLLHFHTAPVSVALPFKIGELYRLRELAVLSGDWGRAVLAVLVERAFDAIVLIVLSVSLIMSGASMPEGLQFIAFILAIALGVALLILFVAEPQLAALQAYVFAHYISSQTRLLLMTIVSVRQAIAVARRSMKGNFLLLMLLSTAIWACEAITLTAIIPAFGGETGSAIIGNIALALSFQGVLTQRPYGLIALGLLFAVWPIATVFYLRSLGRARRPGASPPGGLSLSSSLQSRRIKLHTPRRISCHSN